MKRQYLYLYRTRKPSGWFTHIGYAGVTNSPYHRDLQHRAYQPWSDLIVNRYVIPLGRVPRFVAEIAEYVLIKVTMPVYNVQHNRGNPRRIKPWVAKRQREARYYGRALTRERAHLLVTGVTSLTLLAYVAFTVWSR